MKNEDELLDLVDKNDEVIGTIYRSKTSNDDFGGYLRASELLIVNDKGLLWIPRRQMHKRIAPGGLDFSAAGHVASGEDYMDALSREVEEEINIVLDETKLNFLKKFKPKPNLPPYFRAVYLYDCNEIPKYNHDDFSESFWISPDDLLAKLKAGEPAKLSLFETIEFIVSRKKLT